MGNSAVDPEASEVFEEEEPIDFEYMENARRPAGDGGRQILDHMNEEHSPLTQWGFSHIGFRGKVLDIGCGGGNALRLAMGAEERQDEDAARFYGIDYSEIAIEKAGQFNEEAVRNGKLKLTQADVSSLPFEDGTFDTAYSIESYFFWPDLPGAMKEIFRVLRAGGTFTIIVEMVAGDMSERFSRISEHLHMNILEPEELKKVFENAGFSDVHYDWDTGKGWLTIQGRK